MQQDQNHEAGNDCDDSSTGLLHKENLIDIASRPVSLREQDDNKEDDQKKKLLTDHTDKHR